MSSSPLWLRRQWRQAAERAAQREPSPPPSDPLAPAGVSDAPADVPPAPSEPPHRPSRRPRDPDRKQQAQPPAGEYGDDELTGLRF